MWKRLRRSKYHIVVTQGAKKEMAEAEKEAQKKLNQRTKLDHAKAYRKSLEKKKMKMRR